jgi:hypothetical protein
LLETNRREEQGAAVVPGSITRTKNVLDDDIWPTV